jgi:hypothetical protein
MMAAFFVYVPVMLLQLLQLPAPTADCELEVTAPHAVEDAVLDRFDTAVSAYASLHRRLERALPPEQMFDDPEDMYGAAEALRQALLDARPNVRQGNIFTAEVGSVIRQRLDASLAYHGYRSAEVLAAIRADRLPRTPDPAVNEEFPWGLGSTVWPSLLRALPPLPRELEYRFSNRDLVLLDTHANLVVDILDDALPEE